MRRVEGNMCGYGLQDRSDMRKLQAGEQGKEQGHQAGKKEFATLIQQVFKSLVALKTP